MIKFPQTLTPVPKQTGYFWDVESHKIYSLKIGGVLKELSKSKLHYKAYWHPNFRNHTGAKIGDEFYNLSQEGKPRKFFVKDLMKLKLTDYDIPVINRIVPAQKEMDI